MAERPRPAPTSSWSTLALPGSARRERSGAGAGMEGARWVTERVATEALASPPRPIEWSGGLRSVRVGMPACDRTEPEWPTR
jgi:hypothetical protein